MVSINIRLPDGSRDLRRLNNQALGFLGESIVAFCLGKKGYQVLGRNVKTRFGEIDLIARRDDEVFFIEVKTRRQNRFGWPEEAVTPKKLVHLRRSCLALVPIFVRGSPWSTMVVPVILDVARKKAELRCIRLDP